MQNAASAMRKCKIKLTAEEEVVGDTVVVDFVVLSTENS